MTENSWVPAIQALELVADRFAYTRTLDNRSARTEAKDALLGALANDRLRSCPVGYLTASFDAGLERLTDYRFREVDCNGVVQNVSMNVQEEGEYIFLPQEFWLGFINPASAISANWTDGHFSFRLEKTDGSTLVGEVLHLVFEEGGVASIGLAAFHSSLTLNSHGPGRRALGKQLYCRELQRRIDTGKLAGTLADEARHLHGWLRARHPTQKLPVVETIMNNIRAMYRNAAGPTK